MDHPCILMAVFWNVYLFLRRLVLDCRIGIWHRPDDLKEDGENGGGRVSGVTSGKLGNQDLLTVGCPLGLLEWKMR